VWLGLTGPRQRTSFRGEWTGGASARSPILSIVIRGGDYPCAGSLKVLVPGTTNLIATLPVKWHQDGDQLAGMLDRPGSPLEIARVTLANGRLSGKVSLTRELGGMFEILGAEVLIEFSNFA
jgi:hypothetical protein